MRRRAILAGVMLIVSSSALPAATAGHLAEMGMEETSTPDNDLPLPDVIQEFDESIGDDPDRLLGLALLPIGLTFLVTDLGQDKSCQLSAYRQVAACRTDPI